MPTIDETTHPGNLRAPVPDGRMRPRARSVAARGETAAPGWARLAAIGGIIGGVALGASFGIVPSPPALGASTAVVTAWSKAHHDLLLWSAWLEGIGTFLYVVFLLSLVHLADANRRISGTLTLLAAAVVLGISLVYDVALIAMAQSSAFGGPQLITGTVAYGLYAACEHAFLIAPAILLPLGFALRGSAVLPRAFSNWAIALGCVSEVLGLVGLFYAHPSNGGAAGVAINALVGVEVIWVLAAAVYTLRTMRASTRLDPKGDTPGQSSVTAAAA